MRIPDGSGKSSKVYQIIVDCFGRLGRIFGAQFFGLHMIEAGGIGYCPQYLPVNITLHLQRSADTTRAELPTCGNVDGVNAGCAW
jgi:hypothetical protein